MCFFIYISYKRGYINLYKKFIGIYKMLDDTESFECTNILIYIYGISNFVRHIFSKSTAPGLKNIKSLYKYLLRFLHSHFGLKIWWIECTSSGHSNIKRAKVSQKLPFLNVLHAKILWNEYHTFIECKKHKPLI